MLLYNRSQNFKFCSKLRMTESTEAELFKTNSVRMLAKMTMLGKRMLAKNNCSIKDSPGLQGDNPFPTSHTSKIFSFFNYGTINYGNKNLSRFITKFT